MNEEKKNKLLVVKTNKGCFISDCVVTSGYDYQYHRGKIQGLYFDGEKATGTYYPNWYYIKSFPIKIQEKRTGERINVRYVINDKEIASKKLPQEISYDDSKILDNDILNSLYTYTYETNPDYMVEFTDFDIETILEIDGFEFAPPFEYSAIHREQFSDKVYTITNADIKHQMLDKMIFPEVILHTRPCSLSSVDVYNITRQYIKEHIDSSRARITSDYDFCFNVKKIVPLLEPETVSFHNLFARTKKERSKIKFSTKTYKEVDIFEMTHDQKRYDNYTVIQAITANSEEALKSKLDEWLDGIISIINKPLELCSHCNGSGYVDDIKRIDINSR